MFHSKKPFNQLYITNKTECLSFKSGYAVWVAKLIKELEFWLKTILNYFSFITRVLQYTVGLYKQKNLYTLLHTPFYVFLSDESLLILLMTSLITITIY